MPTLRPIFQRHFFVFSLLVFATSSCDAQSNPTALDTVPIYDGFSFFGMNFGYFPYTDQVLADLSHGNMAENVPGVGALSIRPLLPDFFLEEWGYDIRIDAFKHYDSIGLQDIVAFIGYPSYENREKVAYCGTDTSELFKNMYAPIWDNGENGTPVNDENVAALYIYKTAKLYGPYIRFWEVWNEPDLDYGGNAWRPPGDPGNWWDNNPPPCETAIKAPITHYNRLLRIVYEVVKSVDPNDYVCTGGLGYGAFLDAICRNTDNPIDGSVTSEFPLAGGAYFDCMSFHVYPHIDGSMRQWSNEIGDFKYFRHSDAAALGVVKKRNEFKSVLDAYGFDGVTYPKKTWICTETNIPRKAIQPYVGSEEAQRNFLMKATVMGMQNDILQIHPYALAEIANIGQAENEFHTMGLYPKFQGNNAANETPLQSGIAWRTCSELMKHYRYDDALTQALQFPASIKGAAFKHMYIDTLPPLFVLWAETKTDKSEVANGVYSLPAALGYSFVQAHRWDYATTGQSNILASTDLLLNSSPVIFKGLTNSVPSSNEQGDWLVFPNPTTEDIFVQYYFKTSQRFKLTLSDAAGRIWYTQQPSEPSAVGLYQWHIKEPNLPNGVYFLKLEVGDKKLNKKIIKI